MLALCMLECWLAGASQELFEGKVTDEETQGIVDAVEALDVSAGEWERQGSEDDESICPCRHRSVIRRTSECIMAIMGQTDDIAHAGGRRFCSDHV